MADVSDAVLDVYTVSIWMASDTLLCRDEPCERKSVMYRERAMYLVESAVGRRKRRGSLR